MHGAFVHTCYRVLDPAASIQFYTECLGLEHVRPSGALYVWVRVPGGGGSVAFAERRLAEAAVVVGPGAAYGPSSDGYVRLSLTVPEARLSEAVERIARVV